VGRVLLAGDAAHTNPPYLGQGACSGMRDAANLAWKFDLVLRGLSDAGLLDTYESERRPHARQIMLDSRSLGLVANTASPVKAAVRDLLFKFKLAPKPKFPVLTEGVLARGFDGKPMRQAGTLAPQGRIAVDGRTLRFDEHVGFNFALVASAGAASELPADLRNALQSVGVHFVELAPSSGSGQGRCVFDVDGVYATFLKSLDADVVLTRPDFVVYGHADRTGLAQLAEGFLRQLQYTSAKADRSSIAAPCP
jgi:3-(3-hydroxy-phenyl)propionate hydroxylase